MQGASIVKQEEIAGSHRWNLKLPSPKYTFTFELNTWLRVKYASSQNEKERTRCVRGCERSLYLYTHQRIACFSDAAM